MYKFHAEEGYKKGRKTDLFKKIINVVSLFDFPSQIF
jgi:hypothetical protein